MQDNDWEVDINLGSESMHSIFRKRDILMYEADNDLALACERYQYPQNYLNDDLSSIASSSVVSSRFSEISLHHNIDDFMYDDDPLPHQSTTAITNEGIATKQHQNLPGTVKKLGLRYPNMIQESDDWNDDVEIPAKGISLSLLQQKEYEQQIDFDIDIGSSISERVARSSAPTSVASATAASKFRYEVEADDDQDNMDGLDFPTNMAALPIRLDEKKRCLNANLSPGNAKPTTYKSKIPTSPKSKLLASMREKDDEDFTEGLNIKEKNFHINLSNKSSASCQPKHIGNKGRSPANAPASRLARPTFAPKSRIPELPKRPNLQHQPSSTQPPIRRNFLASASSSLHREGENATVKQRQQQQLQRPTTINKLTKEPIERKSANGYTLISRPKTSKGGYCSQLDSMDNLNDLRPTFVRQLNNNNNKNGADPLRPWRRHKEQKQLLQERTTVKLIKPNEQPISKKYNDMVFDSVNQVWKGNENSLLDFQEKTYRRPMLMTQRQQKPSRYAAVMGHDMVFNADEQKWVSAYGPQQEFNELDAIEDLVDDAPLQRRIMINNRPSGVFGSEFKLSVETKRQMMFDQEMHERFIQNWPLMEEPLINRSGHRVGASKYFLFK